MFRHPILSSAEYLSLYRSGEPEQWSAGEQREEHWSGAEEREDLRIIRSMLDSGRASRVLDVGCGSGEFLASLPPGVAKFGIEPSAAAEVASRRGVEILAGRLEELSGPLAARRFDAVTLIDVIEHVPEPDALLTRAYAQLSAGGLLIVSTGDPNNSLWRRLLKARFWYVAFPEHITFPSSVFFQAWCARAGAQPLERQVTRYQRAGLARRFLGAAIQTAYGASPATFSRLGRSLNGAATPGKAPRQTFSPGVPGTFRDHQILAASKPAL